MNLNSNLLVTVISSGRADKIPKSYNKDWIYIVDKGEKETVSYLLKKWNGALTLNPKRENEILLKRDWYKFL